MLKYRPHYFSYKLNREVEEIYWHSIISSFALSLVFIFEPIYLFSLGYSLIQILLFYILVYSGYLIFITFGARFTGRFGYKHSILVSNVFYILYWFALFYIVKFPVLFFVAPFLFALQKSWFWPPYDSDIAISSLKSQRGRVVGVLFSLVQGSFILGPFVGGFVSEKLGFLILFILAGFLMFLSVYPLFRSPEIHTRHRFRFRTLVQVFREHKSNFFAYWGYAEDLMLQSIWPVYIFIVVPDFVDVGTIATVATLLGTILMLYVGKLSDKADKRKLVRTSSVFYGLTWIFRFFATSLPLVLVFDTLTKAGKDILNVPMMAMTYERAGARGPDYAIAYSVFYEASLSVGKILTASAGILILSLTGSVFLVFALVGVLTMFYSFLK
jgi:MFS family permease